MTFKNAKITSITLPNTITRIGEYAFQNCSNLSSLTIPENVTSIGNYAFQNCSNLSSLTIPENVTTIGASVIGAGDNGCSPLNNIKKLYYNARNADGRYHTSRMCGSFILGEDCEVIIGENVNHIPIYFIAGSEISSITIPSNVTSIGSTAFGYCGELTSVMLPEGLTEIGDEAFYECNSLTTVIARMTTPPVITDNTFSSKWKATLYVPTGTIPNYATADYWKNFKEIKEPDRISFEDSNVEAICVQNWDTNGDGYLDRIEAASVYDLGTFFQNNSQITKFNELQYFTSLSNIPDNAFNGCSNLEAITLSAGVRSIGSSAFENCNSLSSINLYNVKTIGSNAFSGCSGLATVSNLDIVTTIGERAFVNCTSLTSLTIRSLDEYSPNFIATSVGSGAFQGCTNLTTVNFNGGTINSNTFQGCTSLTSITIGYWVTDIKEGAFKNCTALTTINIPGTVITISGGFEGCTALKNVTLNSGTRYIVNGAFKGCSSLASISLPNNLREIGENVFEGTSISEISIPINVTSIQNNAFYGCANLSKVIVKWKTPLVVPADAFPNRANQLLEVPEGTRVSYLTTDVWKDFMRIHSTDTENIEFVDANVEAICLNNWDLDGDGKLQTDEAASVTDLGTAFQGNTEITSFNELQYFKGLTAIAANTFQGCTSLTSVTLGSRVTDIKEGAFRNCTALTTINIPGTVVTISGGFEGCTSLSNVTLNTGTKYIVNGVFTGCSSLKSINLPNGLDYIGESVFEGTGISEINIPSSVTSIQSRAFYGCASLRKVTVNWTTPLTVPADAFPDRANQFLIVPTGMKATYEAANVWMDFLLVMEPGDGYDMPYVVYNNGTLTFYHDGEILSKVGRIYWLNEGDEYPGWVDDGSNANVTTVVFDESFAMVRPTSTYGWFYAMSELSTITNLGNLNTSEVTTMNSMFDGCMSLMGLDLSSFNTSSVESVFSMFAGCKNLKTIIVDDEWDVSDVLVDNSTNMFYECTSLVGRNGTTYDASHIDKTYAHVDGGASNPGYLTDVCFLTDPYAVLSENGTSLTFYKDGQRLTRTEKTYFLNKGIDEPGWRVNRAGITTVVFDESFADARPVSTASWFSGMSNLSDITGMEYLNTSEVTNMSSMFADCTSLTDIDLIHFNTGKVTGVTSMFNGCSGLTTLNLTTFDTQNVTSTSYMFADCSNLTTVYVGDGWNTEKVDAELSEHMFRGCTSLVGDKGTAFDANHTDKEYARVDGGTSAPGYFSGVPSYAALSADGKTLTFYCDMLRSTRGKTYDLNEPGDDPEWYSDIADITTVVFDPSFAGARPVSTSNWFFDISTLSNIIGIEYLNTSEVTNMSNMFVECEGLTSIDLSHFDTGKVTDMNSMFSFCESLTSLDLSSFNTANVTDMSYMFSNCSSLKRLAVGDLNTGKVTNMSSMFEGCSSLTEIDFSGFGFMTTYVTDMSNMFQNCSSLTSINTWRLFAYSTSNVTNMEGMFNNCRSLKALDLTRMKAENVTNLSYMFDGCTNLTEISLSKNFTASNVTNMAYMFRGCTSLTSLDLSSFNTENLENMNRMFMNCQSLKQLDLSSFNTDKVKNKNMEWAFAQCTSLESIDVSNFNTSGLTSLWSMFFNCGSLKVLDLSSFDTKKVTVTTTMFQGCANLKAIFVGDGWDMSKVATSPGMFDGCTSLVGSKGTEYDASHVDKAYAHIDGGASNPGYFSEKGDPYAVLSSDGKTLTFYCDGKRSSHTEATYDLNEPGDDPEWYSDIADITTVVFDSSFAIARPVATSSWFYEMEDLTRIVGMENLNTKDVTDMSSMFFDCMSLTSLDLSHFDTGKVTNMYGMFKACGQLKSLDLSSFATRQVTGMSSMFFNCYSLKTVYVKEDYYYWETSNVEISDNMFLGCISIVGGGGTTYDANNIDKAYARIDTERSPGYFTEKPAFLLGDVNGDGDVNVADVTALVNIVNNVQIENGQWIMDAADVDGSGKVTSDDVPALVNLILGQ